MKKPEIASKTPQIEQLEKGKKYAWCTCGKSLERAWCNGNHKGSQFSPMIFASETNSKASMCMCKQTKTPPHCDGSHTEL